MHLITFFVKWCLRYSLHWNDPWAGLPAPPNSHPRYERPSCWSAPRRGNAAGVNGWVKCTVDTKSTIDFTDYAKNGTRIFKAPFNFSTGRCPQNSAWDVRNNRWMLKIVKGCPVSIWALLLHASQNQEPTVSVVIHQYSRINLINPGSVQNLVNPDIPDVFPNRIGFCQLYQRAEPRPCLGLRFPWPQSLPKTIRSKNLLEAWPHPKNHPRSQPCQKGSPNSPGLIVTPTLESCWPLENPRSEGPCPFFMDDILANHVKSCSNGVPSDSQNCELRLAKKPPPIWGSFSATPVNKNWRTSNIRQNPLFLYLGQLFHSPNLPR